MASEAAGEWQELQFQPAVATHAPVALSDLRAVLALAWLYPRLSQLDRELLARIERLLEK